MKLEIGKTYRTKASFPGRPGHKRILYTCVYIGSDQAAFSFTPIARPKYEALVSLDILDVEKYWEEYKEPVVHKRYIPVCENMNGEIIFGFAQRNIIPDDKYGAKVLKWFEIEYVEGSENE